MKKYFEKCGFISFYFCPLRIFIFDHDKLMEQHNLIFPISKSYENEDFQFSIIVWKSHAEIYSSVKNFIKVHNYIKKRSNKK